MVFEDIPRFVHQNLGETWSRPFIEFEPGQSLDFFVMQNHSTGVVEESYKHSSTIPDWEFATQKYQRVT